jgi:hypothetical protein
VSFRAFSCCCGTVQHYADDWKAAILSERQTPTMRAELNCCPQGAEMSGAQEQSVVSLFEEIANA